MRESWTDARLDGFAVHVDRRFDAVDQRFDDVNRRFDELVKDVDRRFRDVDRRFVEVNQRFDSLERRMEAGFARLGDGLEAMQRAMVYGTLALSGAFVAGFAALVGLVATQL